MTIEETLLGAAAPQNGFHVARGGGTVAGALLLAGSPRPSALAKATGVATLDLSVDGESTLMEVWLERLGELGRLWRNDAVARIVYCARSARPAQPRRTSEVHLEIEQEANEFRGPAGLARDVFETLPPGATVMVIEAARYAGASLAPLVERHLSTGAHITVGMNPDSTPAGVFILRRSTLDLASPRGFMDLKEQWLRAALAAELDVRVCRLDEPGIILLRTREDLLRTALGLVGRRLGGDRVILGRATSRRLSVIARDATVAPDAIVADSVIMQAAVVKPGSVVVRSVLCPGAVAEAGAQFIDSIVSGAGARVG